MTILALFIPKLTELLWEIHLDPSSQTTKCLMLKSIYETCIKKGLLSKYTIIKHAQARAHTHEHTRIYLLSISFFN